jgi:beta-galactosidase
MRRRNLLQGAAIGLAALTTGTRSKPAAAQASKPAPRERIRLTEGWRFHLGHAADVAKDFDFGLNQRTYAKAGWMAASAAAADFDDSGWARVQIPHDWAVDLPFAPPEIPAPEATRDAVAAHGFKRIGRDFPETSIGWYRRRLDVDRADAGRRIWLEFDGVFRNCLVFLNGYIIGRNESGYAPFSVDITDFLDFDGKPNILVVRADASLGEGWFYEGAGIYRHVWMVKTAQVHVPQWGTFVRSEIEAGGAHVRVTTDVRNLAEEARSVTLRQRILDPNGAVAATLDETTLAISPDQRIAHDANVTLRTPRLWSIERPELYRLVSEIVADGAVIDRYETSFGIRSIRFDAARGFFLNGKPVKLLGTCNHQDHAGVGTGIPDALSEWRVAQTQSMGANAWRNAHNPPSEALLDQCDRMGMLMIDEARLNSTDAEAMDQLERILRRDRNHPCVILWSVGNEEPHQGSARGARVTQEMVRKVRSLDPTRPTTQAFDNSWDKGAAQAVDVIGFNYRTDKIEAFHQQFPDKPVYGSETGSTVSTRGEYFNDASRHISRAYDTEHPWWASTAEAWWMLADARPYIAGGFIWTGFDYRGEPTPFPAWPSVSSYFGVLDLCGFPKDNYWYYRAWWRPEEPLVHLLPHWNWAGREGQPIEIWAHSNCEEVELLVNGRSLGRKRVERSRHVQWTAPFAPGRIEARGYRDGKRVAGARHETTGAPAAVRLVAETRRIKAGADGLAILRAEIVDAKGRIVPDAGTPLRFEVQGPGRLIGVGNGDPTSHESDRGPDRSAFNGLAQALVQSSGAGAIRVTAEAKGLRSGSVTVLAV